MAKFSIKRIAKKLVNAAVNTALIASGGSGILLFGLKQKEKALAGNPPPPEESPLTDRELRTGFNTTPPPPIPTEEVVPPDNKIIVTPTPPQSRPIEYTTVTIRSQNYPQRNFVVASVDNDLYEGNTIVVPNTYFNYIVTFSNNGDTLGRRYISSWLYNKLLNDYKTDIGRVLSNLDPNSGVYPYYNFDWEVFKSATLTEMTKRRQGVDVPELIEDDGVLNEFDATPEYLLQWLDFPLKDSNNFPTKQFPLLIDYGFRPVLTVRTEEVLKRNSKGELKPVYNVVIIPSKNPVMTEVETGYISLAESDEYSGVKQRQVDGLTTPQTVSVSDALNSAGKTGLSSLLGTAAQLAGKALKIRGKLAAAAGIAKGLSSIRLPKVELSKIKVFPKTLKERKKNIKRKTKLKPLKKSNKPLAQERKWIGGEIVETSKINDRSYTIKKGTTEGFFEGGWIDSKGNRNDIIGTWFAEKMSDEKAVISALKREIDFATKNDADVTSTVEREWKAGEIVDSSGNGNGTWTIKRGATPGFFEGYWIDGEGDKIDEFGTYYAKDKPEEFFVITNLAATLKGRILEDIEDRLITSKTGAKIAN